MRIGVSNRGVGASVGVPGARVGISGRGVHSSLGIPGTGLSYQTRHGGGGGMMRQPSPPMSNGMSCLVVLGVLVAISMFVAGGAAGKVLVVLVVVCAIVVSFLMRRARRLREEAEWAAEQQSRYEQAQAEQAANHQRWSYLCSQYGEEGAGRIWEKSLWVGAPVSAVVEMFGAPEDVKTSVRATRVKENYRYWSTGVNRYAMKIDIEDGVVTGWDR